MQHSFQYVTLNKLWCQEVMGGKNRTDLITCARCSAKEEKKENGELSSPWCYWTCAKVSIKVTVNVQKQNRRMLSYKKKKKITPCWLTFLIPNASYCCFICTVSSTLSHSTFHTSLSEPLMWRFYAFVHNHFTCYLKYVSKRNGPDAYDSSECHSCLWSLPCRSINRS